MFFIKGQTGMILTIVLSLLLLGAVLLLWFTTSSNLNTQSSSPNPGPSQSPIGSDTRIPDDWHTFTSNEHDFIVQYPMDMRVQDRQRDAIRFIKFGPTQRENTEVYDAISLRFNSGSLEGKSLEDFVRSKIEEARATSEAQVIAEIEPVTIAGYNGFKYRLRGLGESTHIYLPKGENGYLMIVDATVDPQNQGFARTVDMMLSTLKIGTPSSASPDQASQMNINLYFVALEDNGRLGQKIGCNDSIVAVQIQIPQTQTPLEASLMELLSIKQQRYGEQNYYNALANSNLQFQSAVINEETATIRLDGNLQLGGTCDNPRVEAQLRQTVLQFPSVKNAEIIINNQSLETVLSEK